MIVKSRFQRNIGNGLKRSRQQAAGGVQPNHGEVTAGRHLEFPLEAAREAGQAHVGDFGQLFGANGVGVGPQNVLDDRLHGAVMLQRGIGAAQVAYKTGDADDGSILAMNGNFGGVIPVDKAIGRSDDLLLVDLRNACAHDIEIVMAISVGGLRVPEVKIAVADQLFL